MKITKYLETNLGDCEYPGEIEKLFQQADKEK